MKLTQFHAQQQAGIGPTVIPDVTVLL